MTHDIERTAFRWGQQANLTIDVSTVTRYQDVRPTMRASGRKKMTACKDWALIRVDNSLGMVALDKEHYQLAITTLASVLWSLLPIIDSLENDGQARHICRVR